MLRVSNAWKNRKGSRGQSKVGQSKIVASTVPGNPSQGLTLVQAFPLATHLRCRVPMSLQMMRTGLHTNPPTLMVTQTLALLILESQKQACQISFILMRILPISMPMTRWAQWAPLPFGTPLTFNIRPTPTRSALLPSSGAAASASLAPVVASCHAHSCVIHKAHMQQATQTTESLLG